MMHCVSRIRGPVFGRGWICREGSSERPATDDPAPALPMFGFHAHDLGHSEESQSRLFFAAEGIWLVEIWDRTCQSRICESCLPGNASSGRMVKSCGKVSSPFSSKSSWIL
jgi:hypothetical protein